MPFKFRYKTVLKYREDQEKRAKNDLALANMAVEKAKHALEEAESAKRKYYTQIDSAILNGLNASEFQKFDIGKAYYEQTIYDAQRHIEMCEQEVERVRKLMIDATQEKKKMEKLREKAFKKFREKEFQEESIVVDNLVTYNSSRNVEGD